MPSLEELRSLIRDEVRAIVDPEGYRAGQQRVRQSYMDQLQNELVDFDLVDRDREIAEEAREMVLQTKGNTILLLRRRIEDLDRALSLGENGNRAQRRRKTGTKR